MASDKRIVLFVVGIVTTVVFAVDIVFAAYLIGDMAQPIGLATVVVANLLFIGLCARVVAASKLSVTPRGVERAPVGCVLHWSQVRTIRRRGYILQLWDNKGKRVTIYLALFRDPEAVLEYVQAQLESGGSSIDTVH